MIKMKLWSRLALTLKFTIFSFVLFGCATSEEPKGIFALSDSYLYQDEEIAGNLQEEEYFAEDDISMISAATESAPEHNRSGKTNKLYGSANVDKSYKKGQKVYFLYGAEHLKLDNYYFDIPVVYNSAVKKWINYFLSRGKRYFVRYSERSGRYAPILGKILEDHGVPRDLIFLAMAESGFHNNAKSWAKAVGPWQFMPYTGKKFGLEIDWFLDERRDPIKATVAAARYLKTLHKIFGAWELAIAGYNAGEGKVGRAIKRYKTENFWELTKGRYLKPETKNYVPKIMALAIIGKNLHNFGFDKIDFHAPLDFDEVDLPGNTDLIKLAEQMEVPYEEIRKYNPEILRWMIPPNVSTYKLRLPVGLKKKFNSCCADKDLIASDYQYYKVKTGGPLRTVARKYKLKSKVLAQLNHVSVNKKYKRGDLVKLPFRKLQSVRDPMYADLYERPRRRVRKRRRYRSRIRLGMKRGRKISSPSQYYRVKKGDTLWNVARKNGVSLNTLIRNNSNILSSRQIRSGDRLVIK